MFDTVYGIEFPNVDPAGDEVYIDKLGDDIINKILSVPHKKDEKIEVFIMGESGLVFNVVRKLKALGIRCIYSTTERVVLEKMENGEVKKISTFRFVKFREYV